MKSSYVALISLFLLLAEQTSQAGEMPENVMRRIKFDMPEVCQKLFLNDGFLGYQSLSGGTHKIFVISEGYRCAWAKKDWLIDSWEDAEKKAIAACEKGRTQGPPCVAYAHNNEIIFVSAHQKIEMAQTLIEVGDVLAAEKHLIGISNSDLAMLNNGARGEYEFLSGKILIIKDAANNRVQAVARYNNAWSKYGNIDGALEEGNQRIEGGDIEKDWLPIRNAYQYFLAHATDMQKAQHPEVQQNIQLTEKFYREDLGQREQAEKRQRMIDVTQAKREADRLARQEKIEAELHAKQERLEAIKTEREQRKQESLRKAEEQRIAREGDGSNEDLTCKGYGAKPGTQPYINCRIQLDAAKQNLASQRGAQAENNRRAEVARREQAEAQALRAAAEENRRNSAALMAIGAALAGGATQPAAERNEAACAYDDFGNKRGCYPGYQACVSATRMAGWHCR